MSEKIVQINEAVIKSELKELVRGSVEETLNELLEAKREVFPEAKYQRCTVHFYRNAFFVIPRPRVKLVAKMLKAIRAQESEKTARQKAKAVVEQLLSMKRKEAAKKVEDSIEKTLTYCDFPGDHWGLASAPIM